MKISTHELHLVCLVIILWSPLAHSAAFPTNSEWTTPEEAPVVITYQAPAGTTPSFKITGDPTHGKLDEATPGGVTYTPDKDWNGDDSFRVQRVGSGQEVIRVTVSPVYDPPTAYSDEILTEEDLDGGLDLRADSPDNLQLTFELHFDKDTRGDVTVTPDGHASYIPPRDFFGVTGFAFRACDGTSCSKPVTIRVKILPVNDRPTSRPIQTLTNANTPVTITLPCQDIDSDKFTFKTSQIAFGAVSEPATDGGVVFTPEPDFLGRGSFAYRCSDGELASESVFVTIDVKPVNFGLASQRLKIPDTVKVPVKSKTKGVGATAPTADMAGIFKDFAELGAHAFYRPFGGGDVIWEEIEPVSGKPFFARADRVVAQTGIEPIATVFAHRLASPTPPWEESSNRFVKEFGNDAGKYLDTVLERYRAYIRYWVIGGEMMSWAVADPRGGYGKRVILPKSYPRDGYSVVEQSRFLRDAARYIKEVDDDAVIILPPIEGLDENGFRWIETIVAGSGKDWFDIVSYRDFSGWENFDGARARFQSWLNSNNLIEKPVWLLGTASSSDPSNLAGTNYPNSEITQAGDVFRRLLAGYAHGDAMVMWNDYVHDTTAPTVHPWRGHGLKTEADAVKPAHHAMKLFLTELLPFSTVDDVSPLVSVNKVYAVTTASGILKFVAWGRGGMIVPKEVTQLTSVVPDSAGKFSWQPAPTDQVLMFSDNDIPVLMK